MYRLSKKVWLVVIALLIITALIIGSSLNKSKQQAATIDLQVVPSGSTVTIDGKGVSSGKVKVTAGEHVLKASKEGFESQTKKFSIAAKENRFMGVALVSNSTSTRNWYDEHPEEKMLAESIGSRSFDQSSSDIAEKYPIISELPFIDQFYSIDYGRSVKNRDDPTAIAIYVTYYSKDGKAQALKWLEFKGYKPSNIEIIYDDKAVD